MHTAPQLHACHRTELEPSPPALAPPAFPPPVRRHIRRHSVHVGVGVAGATDASTGRSISIDENNELRPPTLLESKVIGLPHLGKAAKECSLAQRRSVDLVGLSTTRRHGLPVLSREPSAASSSPSPSPQTPSRRQSFVVDQSGLIRLCSRETSGALQSGWRQGMVSECLTCGEAFAGNEKQCLSCASRRLYHKEVDEVFRLFTLCRATLRKGDLSNFTFHSWSVHRKQSGSCKEKTFRRFVLDVGKAFDEALEALPGSGVQHGQGLTVDGFQILVRNVARLIGCTGSEFLAGLFEEGGPSPPSSGKLGFGDSCGHGDPCPHGFRSQVAPGRVPVCGVSVRTDFDEIISLGRKHMLPFEQVRDKKNLFNSCDTNGDQALSKEEFDIAIRKFLHIPPNEEIPQLSTNWAKADKDGIGTIDFEEFLLWSVNCQLQEP